MNAIKYLAGATLTAVIVLGGAVVAMAQEDAETVEEPVSVIEMITGILEKLDRDYLVNGIEIGFGPFFYRDEAPSPADFDGDGSTGTVTAELDGLVGTEVTIETEDGDAMTVNGAVYRDAGAKPAWAGPPSWAPGPPPFAGAGDEA